MVFGRKGSHFAELVAATELRLELRRGELDAWAGPYPFLDRGEFRRLLRAVQEEEEEEEVEVEMEEGEEGEEEEVEEGKWRRGG